MAQFNRWWDSLGKAERIVAISVGLSAPIAIINSTVWAIAVTVMHVTRQRARVEIERVRALAKHEAAVGAAVEAALADPDRAHERAIPAR
ncbi:MAG TPA: hypothetical protein VGR57_14170 [Ktedonobacterales bacterium]|nr:hypothetical protein [Ktedonobacterales bacterium]